MITKRVYFTILIMFVTVFGLFMYIGISSNLVTDNTTNLRAPKDIKIGYNDILSSDSLNIDGDIRIDDNNKKTIAAIISQDQEDMVTNLLVEWCIYNKYLYKIHTSLPAAKDLEEFDIILFGDVIFTKEDSKVLYSYADLVKTMIFTKLPDYRLLRSDKKLADFFGIEAMVNQNIEADGIKIFPDFMIGGERIYQKGDYFGTEDDTSVNIPYYSLSPGYEVYAVGLFDNQNELEIENKELPPLLWRTKTKNSFIFVVNGDIFHGVPLLGIMTGFMVHRNECYLYPIVNAQTISLINYPYLSNENETKIEEIYSRGADALSRDILWPNIIQVLRNYGDSYNFFAASQLDYMDGVGPDGDYIGFYLKEINKLPGEMGLSLGQVSEAALGDIIDTNDRFFKEHLPEYDFSALFLADFDMDEIKGELEHDLLDNISLIMDHYTHGDRLIDFINDTVLSVKFNLDGYRHETLDDLQMKTTYNALGMCNMTVDIGRVIYPEDDSDEWNNLSLIWSRGDTYFKNYSDFDMVSIYEMESRVRRFLALDFVYEYNNDDIDLRIENFEKEAYFILSVYDKSIVSVNNAEVKRISKDTYLIMATEADVQIQLKERNLLESPANNIIIPYDPEERYPKEDGR